MVELHDIEMKEVDPSNGSNSTHVPTTSKDEKKDTNTLTLDGKSWWFDCILLLKYSSDIKEQVRTIEKAVNSKEPRYILRVLRALASTRKRLNEDVIRRLIVFYYGLNSTEREVLLGFAQSVSQVRFFSTSKKSTLLSLFCSLWTWIWKKSVTHQHQVPVTSKLYLALRHLEHVLLHYLKLIYTFIYWFFSIWSIEILWKQYAKWPDFQEYTIDFLGSWLC